MSTKEEQLRYIEELALSYEQAGQPRASGRVLGWLLLCDPPHQTMDDLVQALQISKSSVSTATRQLIQVGLIERISLPGERRDFYGVGAGIWTKIMQGGLIQITALRQLAEKGLALLADEMPERRARLQEMRDMYAFFEREMPILLARWEAERKQGQLDE
ncbi:MAG: MarR family transcriptional regulator [Ardenticatenaceae bacterium]|nr:MarR family transcriptional regulator [Ardenticatenaceae bacterium]